ncbi:MAG: formate dehydrogenase subunit gamma [Burkholderiales bacterium]
MMDRCLRVLLLSMAAWAALPGGVATAEDYAKEQVQQQQNQPLNNQPVWKEVRSGAPQVTQIRGIETDVLVQPMGETWRQIRNGPIKIYGATLLVIVLAAISLFYLRKGEIRLHGTPTGRLILRFTSWERLVHWGTAISFSILALSGLIILFGRHILLPIFGLTLFSWLAILCKNLHNFTGPAFIIFLVLLIGTFVRNNFPEKGDLRWLLSFGGLFSGKETPSGKFNAGEKLWFWGGALTLGSIVAVSGLVLDFPNFDQGRETMQIAHMIHAVAALCMMAAACGHIYMGTLGMQGAYEAMRYGVVDETWAKEHHEYWYEAMKSAQANGGRGGSAPLPGVAQREF